MQEIRSLNLPVVTGICDSNKEFVIQIILKHGTITEVTCVGCFEITISVVKHVQSIGIIRTFCLLGET